MKIQTQLESGTKAAHFMVPKDQQRKGIRIRGIGCTSPVRHSGLRAGDVVLCKWKVTFTKKKNISVYGRLLIWKDVRLSILRNGKPMSIDYSIRK